MKAAILKPVEVVITKPLEAAITKPVVKVITDGSEDAYGCFGVDYLKS